jgi:isocitrate/isopropylmalate dehydrogenase
MILACGAVMNHASERYGVQVERASRAIYEAALETVASGVKTFDLGGSAGTTEFTTAVIDRIRTKRDVWDSLG